MNFGTRFAEVVSTNTPKEFAKMAKKASKSRSKKRELIDTGSDKRYVRRDRSGRFQESDNVGRSLAQDRKKKAKATAKPGYGDRGDRKAKR